MAKKSAKPFLKWAGGKTQLIAHIKECLPKNLEKNKLTYIEPFVGSGAVFFWMMQHYKNIEKAVINDINTDLINCYITIKEDVDELLSILSHFQTEYHTLFYDLEKSKEYYYQKRELFNTRKSTRIVQSALFIFLNKTCFNGLYRVNSKNQFNVPIGRSKSLPAICNRENLKAVSKVLKRAIILNGDYTETIKYTNEASLFYFDPPYKPLTKTSSFNSYAKEGFNDNEQIRLKTFCELLDNNGHQWILSNSDMKNTDPNNAFFDDLYADFTIVRINARRSINSNGKKRGKLTELLITN